MKIATSDPMDLSALDLRQRKKALAKCETALLKAEATVKRCAQGRRELEACTEKCLAAEQEALARARRLAAEQDGRRRAAKAIVSELAVEEQEARVHAIHLGHRSPTPGETSCEGSGGSSVVLDIYQHSHYEVEER